MRARALLLAAAGLLVLPGAGRAQATHLVVVTGLGGDPEMRRSFHEWAVRLVDTARTRFRLPDERVVYLAERPDLDPERIDGPSRREVVTGTLQRLADAAGADDRLLLVLLGHGSWSRESARFNLPGPDLTASGLDDVLSAWGSRTVAVVNAASASGAWTPILSGPGRIVLTATRSGRERNATRFGEFFVDALAGDGADVDQDGSVSLLEAFDYARREVARRYEERNLLLTEHAQLDDDGDGEATLEPADSAGADGARAAAFVLGGDARTADDDPELAPLYDERRRLEERVRDLRARKDDMETAAYRDSLEAVLLQLARLSRRIRALEEGGG